MSTFDSTGARRRRRQIDVFARGRLGLRVGPHDDGHRRRRRAARRPARPRTRGRRRRRLLSSRPALLPPHVALATARPAAVAFRRRELPGEASQIPEPLAALAPLEVAARGRVDPRRLVALATHIFILLRDDGAAPADRRHRGRRGRCDWLLARYRFLWSALTTDHYGDGRVALARWRWSRHGRRPPRIRTWLSSTHDAVPSPSCLRSRVIDQCIIRGSFAPQDAIERWNIRHLYCGRNSSSDR